MTTASTAIACQTGCGCVDPCILFADDFNRANTTTLSDYTETSGNWQVTSNRLHPPAVGLLKINLSTPVSPDGVKIQGVCNFSGFTGEWSLVVDYVDLNNYHYGTVVCTGSTSATLKLVKVSGGVATDLTSAAVVPGFNWSNDFTLRVCWDDEYLAATVVTTLTLADAAPTTGHGGNFTAIRHVAANDAGRFDDLDVSSMEEGCPKCAVCDACDPDLLEVQVDLAGFTAGAGCDCAAVLNGTHFLELTLPATNCNYEKSIVHTCGAAAGFDIGLFLDSGSDLIDAFVNSTTGGTMSATFQKSGIGTCSDWSAMDIPLDVYTQGAQCGIATPTFAITAA